MATYHRTHGVRYLHGRCSIGGDTLWDVNHGKKSTAGMPAAPEIKSVPTAAAGGRGSRRRGGIRPARALLFRQVSTDVTLFRHTGADLTDGQWEQLAGLGVGVVDGEVGALEVDDRGRLAGLRLASGAVVPVRKLVVSPRFVARVGFLGGLGLTVREHPMGVGEQVVVDGTGVAGVWAAGNVSDVLAGVPAASAAGVTAAAAINMNLLTTDARRTAAARAAGAEVFSGVMESGVSRRVLGTRVHGLDSLLDNS
ncbi:hypothetical protein [Streptomyces sp. NPDC059802]|uniref:hypothetical protein n=1 Tax=Streptomyces sp. NPDC059802 TaxID=3346952 RepID=UPI00365CF63F